MGIFSRLFKVGQAEAHSAVEKLEDPIKLTEQAIRDLKKDLDQSLKSLAEVKAVAIRSRKEMNEYDSQAKSYEHKAMQLVQKAQSGGISEEEADRLATEALNRKGEAEQKAATSRKHYEQLQQQISQLNGNVDKLKSSISKYENELKMLKARSRVSNATGKLNKSMAKVDSSSSMALLERMKDKVEQQEALSEAYGDMAQSNQSFDDEIDDALGGASESSSSSALAELKAKMNQQNQ